MSTNGERFRAAYDEHVSSHVRPTGLNYELAAAKYDAVTAKRIAELEALLVDWQKAEANGDQLGTCSVCGDFRAVDECDPETGALACQRCQANELQERLAKLEAALGFAVTQLEGTAELLLEEEVRGEEDGINDIREWTHEIRTGLLKDKHDLAIAFD
jgi:hypothetical protein